MARQTSHGTIGGNTTIMGVSANVPTGQQNVNPFIGVPISSDGATVYTLLNSIFDPRVIYSWNAGDNYDQNFTLLKDNRIPERKMMDLLYYRIFDERPGRQEPSEGELHQLIDNIADISRMLGIYYTAAAMKESRDPEMYLRARRYELNNTFSEMQTILSELPLPRVVAQLNAKYIGLMDVATDNTWQNIGFLVNGTYETFLALYNNVRSRRFGLRWMNAMYPKLGVLGTPPAKSYDPDFMTVFANGVYKLLAPGEVYAPYVVAQGASDEPMQLASAGILHAVEANVDGAEDPNNFRTLTGWAFPGSGNQFGTFESAIRTPYPALCKYVDGQDRELNPLDNSGATSDALTTSETLYQAASVNDRELLVNIAHEYNLIGAEGETARVVTDFDFETGQWLTSASMSGPQNDYVGRRLTAGFSKGQLSYQLDANLMSFLAAVVAG